MSSRRAVSDKNIQEKLELYRKQKEQEKLTASTVNLNTKVINFLKYITDRLYKFILPEIEDDQTTADQNFSEIENDISDDPNLLKLYTKRSKVEWMVLGLKIILWLIIWKLFILLEFGAVYFVCSCFFVMWFNLYSGSKRKGPSAYSVFNSDFEQIQGTYSAEKLEKELLHR